MTGAWEFAIVVMAVSASGVMAPGPLFVANISYGLASDIKSAIKAGTGMATGHAVVELPLVLMLGAGVLSLESFPGFRVAVSILGAVSLFAFAAMQVRSAYGQQRRPAGGRHGPFAAGILLTGLNPFFIVWWLGVGSRLISDATAQWGPAGILIMFGIHIWMDFAWLAVVACLASRGRRAMPDRFMRTMMIGLGAVMVYFGVAFLGDAMEAARATASLLPPG